jgi:hypothetical protein
MTWDIASAQPIAKTQEILEFLRSPQDSLWVNVQKPGQKRQNISHPAGIFPFGV